MLSALRPKRAVNSITPTNNGSASNANTPKGQCNTNSVAISTKGVTAPLITGVNTCAGNCATAIMPWVIR